MKNFKILFAVLFLCLSMATMGWCLTIVDGPYTGTDPGNIDTWIATTTALSNSNPTTEAAWVNLVLGLTTVTFYAKNDPAPIYTTDTDGVYATHMTTPPESEYFIVKNSKSWALFANTAAMDFGVFDVINQIPGMNVGNDDDITVSHVSRFDGTPVPEPATMLLVGFGLLGLTGFGRKKFKK